MEILSYSFFQNALFAGIFIAISSAIIGNYIVIRREVQIGHTIANASFLGIIIGLIFQITSEITAVIFSIIAAIAIYFLEKSKKITSDSIMEYISQISMALGIFLLSFLPGLKVDIFSFLFGNILAVNTTDIYLSVILFLIISIYFYFLGKILLGNSMSYEISKATQKHGELANISFLVLTSLLIALSIKIFGILLIGAFLVVPANIGKLAGKSFKQMKYISVIVSVLSVILGLFGSYYFDASPGATIVLLLGIGIIIAGMYSKIIK